VRIWTVTSDNDRAAVGGELEGFAPRKSRMQARTWSPDIRRMSSTASCGAQMVRSSLVDALDDYRSIATSATTWAASRSGRHPAVTAAIIGPRTMEQFESQLGGADVTLDDALLDRIDEIVAPGTTINPADAGWSNPALAATARRR
jgi:aryl-alcohol dehydrogenase-like predicted oxidoreductase